MTCAACVRRIEKALAKVDGVQSAVVNLASERATIIPKPDADPAALRAALTEAVYSAGYGVRDETATMILRVRGMTCAACVNRIERALKKAPGVIDAAVNLASEQATVKVDTSMTDRPALVRAVESAGYAVSDDPVATPDEDTNPEPLPLDREDRRRAREQRMLLIQFAVSFAVSVVLMLLMFGSEWFYLPWWRWNHQDLYPLLFYLATPVQFWAGWRFYRSAFYS
ncbi:MAG: heavy metal translocating P-type ATPase, partial [Dehalococcoidia bacterium]|nr:heavy metal translocating P-type ATPase [Dehalococcoidia bacterium]